MQKGTKGKTSALGVDMDESLESEKHNFQGRDMSSNQIYTWPS